jgi:glycosyltransferase involved in cell wall biosynthesis
VTQPLPGQLKTTSLLLVLPVAFRLGENGELLFEKQACNGLERWLENFQSIVVACPLEPRERYAGRERPGEYEAVENLPNSARMTFVTLPWAYTLVSFLQTLGRTRRLLRAHIEQSKYLSFAIGGLVGDWAAVAAYEASLFGRPYSVWTDRVEHRVARGWYRDSSGARRIVRYVKNRLIVSPLMKRLEHAVISRAALGLFHGNDCFTAYAAVCREPHLVHDIHLKAEDQISETQLRHKLGALELPRPLHLVYAGRAAAMKGPMEWLEVLARLRNKRVAFKATWLGDGPQLQAMKDEIQSKGLTDAIALPGHTSNRSALLATLRDADLFLFCHQTPESPRCLIEALMSACPIIGFDAPYPRDLLAGNANGLLVPLNDTEALATAVALLDADRGLLRKVTRTCAELGTHYSDHAVFKHRSDLIKKYLR